MFVVKKLVRRLPPVAASPGRKVFYVSGTGSKHGYLVDTGACQSLIPKAAVSRPGKKGPPLKAANGSYIGTYGRQQHTIHAAGSSYIWKFVVADVFLPILGADFLHYFDLLVDMRRRRLIPASSIRMTTEAKKKDVHRKTPTPAEKTPACSAATSSSRYENLKEEFKDVFSDVLRPPTTAGHDVRHYIKTSGPPVFAKYRRLPPEKLAAAKQCFSDMEKQGICQKASSPWASPLHIVEKKDGSIRPCGDYRRLNIVTEADHYPLPNISDTTSYLNGARVFTKLDMTKGYFQLPMNPEDIPKTAITTPFGTFTFNYSCFGLKNAGATFQRLMDSILGDFPFCVCYVDDVLIFSASHEEHEEHIRKVLGRLRENKLVVKNDKCVFGAESVTFLGHKVSSNGVAPLPSKVEGIRKFPKPTTVKKLQEFLGMVTFYHRFLPRIANILAPLNELLKGKPKQLEWTMEAEEAFNNAKKTLANATLLAYPSPSATLHLYTDASNVAVGAVLEQKEKGVAKPLGFFSKKLSPTEKRYSTFDRELLAVFSAIKYFKHLLLAKHFEIFTDHLPLVHAFVKRTDQESQRQQRQLTAIAEYDCTILHLPGKQNKVADALSRNVVAVADIGLDIKRLQKLQQEEEESAKKNTTLQLVRMNGEDETSILCDVSTGKPRPWIPKEMRREVFNLIHNLAHPSKRATTKMMTDKYVWHAISKDCKMWAKECLACQRCKTHRHTETGVGTIEQPRRRFGHIHVDVVGPLPASNGYKYLFTMIDRSTRWPEAVPMKNATTEECVNALLSGWIAKFGLPDIISSDRGSQFTSNLWKSMATSLGVDMKHTTSYNPEANGMVERFHRTLKAALMATCKNGEWNLRLPWVLLGLRTTPKAPGDVSIAEKVYGDTLQVPGDFFKKENIISQSALRREVDKYIPCEPTFKDRKKKYIPPDLNSCSHVFIRVDAAKPPLTPPYTGPYTVKQKKKKSWQLDIRGTLSWVSIDRLKPAYLPPEYDPRQYTRSGRLIKKLFPQGGSDVGSMTAQ